MKLFTDVAPLEKGIDAAWMRNQVISNNIANVDNPGFKSSKVEFESVFKAALSGRGIDAKKTRDGHRSFGSGAENVSASVVQNSNTTMRHDGNNVDIDYESAELAKNTIYYNTLVQKISSEFRRLSMAINEGK